MNSDCDKGLEDFTEAIRLDRNNGTAYYNRGWVYKEQGRLDEAIADFTEAIRLSPQDVDPRAHRGVAYAKKARSIRPLATSQK